MDSAALIEYVDACEAWAEARHRSEYAVLETMQAEDRVLQAETRLRYELTGEQP